MRRGAGCCRREACAEALPLPSPTALMEELLQREEEMGITPDPEVWALFFCVCVCRMGRGG